MTVGLLLITHNDIGAHLLATAREIMGGAIKTPVDCMAIRSQCEPSLELQQATRQIALLDSGQGVLILTDLYGATPSNIANRLACHSGIRVVAGLNLPMLVRVLNYADLGLDELTEKAVSGGQASVFTCTNKP
ncbi:MAG: PTS fructose transporter subunit IIA [Gammaproteobacteria bacterium]|nr:PTS fructose transporter subunit IIA [Gammaproteobacteria bacterium]